MQVQSRAELSGRLTNRKEARPGAEPGEELGESVFRGEQGSDQAGPVFQCEDPVFYSTGLRSHWRVKNDANDSLLVPTTYLVLCSLSAMLRMIF